MADLILFGPPGGGKSSVASRLVERDGYIHLSTGNILRDEMKAGTPIGLAITEKMNAGQFADDDMVNHIVAQMVAGTALEQRLIFDGHPRNAAQVEFFRTLMTTHRRTAIVVRLLAKHDILLQRIMMRAMTEGRGDDTPEVFRERLSIYAAKTAPVFEKLSNIYPHVDIDTSYLEYDNVYEVIRRYA